MADVRVIIFPAAIKALERDSAVVRETRIIAARMAARAAAGAPRHSGQGAASIHGDAGTDPAEAVVSWDQAHFYMIFQEEGFHSNPGRHFLRRTFESYVHS